MHFRNRIASLSPAVLLLLCIGVPSSASAQSVDVTVTLRDAATLEPIRDAVLRFQPTSFAPVTDSAGALTVQLRPGTYEIAVEHVAYGLHSITWTLSGDDASTGIEIRLD